MPYSKEQTWGALKKCWKGYKIAKAQNDRQSMLEYAKRIRRLQYELNIQQSQFPELGLL